MGQYKVYISSTYRDLAEHRLKVLEFFHKKTMQQYFDVVSMEGYVANDIEPRLECIDDVKNCSVYILILAKRYGYIPPELAINPEQISITELEYNAAVASSKPILVFFCDETVAFEDDNDEAKKAKLKQFKQKVQSTKMMHPIGFTNSYHLALQVAESIINRYSLTIDSTNRNLDEVIYCDRSSEINTFNYNFDLNSTKLLHFYLINSHEKDMPRKFIERKTLDFDNEGRKVAELFIRPAMVEKDDFSRLEYNFKVAIKEKWNDNKNNNNITIFGGRKLQSINDVNFENVLSILDTVNIEYLIITWEIQSFFWKNDKIREYITELYHRFEGLNKNINHKKIFFIGIVSFTEDCGMSYEEFQGKIIEIQFGQESIKLSKIPHQEIKNWLTDCEIEDNPDIQKAMISEKIPFSVEGSYYSILEIKLKEILKNIHLIQP